MTDDFDEYARRHPCVGCGYCCQKAPCFLSARLYGRPECPMLVHDGDRYWCAVVIDADQRSSGLGARMRDELCIGAGCSSTLFNTQREAQLAKHRAPTSAALRASSQEPSK